MRIYVLLILLNELRKRDKILVGFAEHLISFNTF